VAVLDAGLAGQTPELKRYYPTDVLVTGFDIIFFWVARMMMMGLHFMGEVPFHTVYIHALVRDEKGQKMSKSKGNVIDPLDLIDEYGADALRFTLAAMAAQGRDIKLSTPRRGLPQLRTKLWNAARFAEMNGCVPRAGKLRSGAQPSERSTAGSSARTRARRERHRTRHRGLPLQRCGQRGLPFVWNVFCDWYLELAKPVLTGADEARQGRDARDRAWVLDEILKLLHPFMPFITEEKTREQGFRCARAGRNFRA
jgi:valyl-tRNA synthetase